MQRERNVKVKEVIESLCNLLSLLGIQSVPKPETFRRAKFNRGDGTTVFWRFLYSLLKREVHLDCVCAASQESDIEAQVSFVKSVLRHCGYGVMELYQLSSDGSQGSRELLLAVSWVLSTGCLLERLLEKTWLKLEDHITLSVLPLSVCTDEDVPVAGTGVERLERGIRDVQWWHGKLQFTWKTLQAAQEERAVLLHKIHSYTKGCHSNPSINHLSVMETYLMKDPKEQNRMLKLLQMEIALLESYLQWKLLEPLYWCWMDSVTDSKLADTPPSQHGFHNNIVAMAPKVKGIDEDCCQGNMDMRREINQLGKVLMDLNVVLQGALSAKRASWCSLVQKKEMGVPSDPEELGATVVKLQERVNQRLSALTTHRDQGKTIQDTTYILVLKERPPRKHRSGQGGRADDILASQVIHELKGVEASLQTELSKLQQDCRDEIMEIVGKMEGIIFIPPMKK
ncbi:tubulin epsilon and delta complex protein 1 [Amia ocellicauda]|uniref:tubulin epsilon and delta complex protein 1 n=1 Tax=Amia ocellicauda TaxID=2972642 RepID=UPI003464E807